jgi:hypothetical protein
VVKELSAETNHATLEAISSTYEASSWNFREHIVDEFLRHLIEKPRACHGWRYAIDGDILLRQFFPEGLRQGNDAGLRGTVGGGPFGLPSLPATDATFTSRLPTPHL